MSARGWLLPVFLGLLLVTLQLLAVLNPAIVEVDPEEMVNASHAWTIAQDGLGLAFPLQYRPFCGGCTATALVGAGLFSVFPPLWMVWKLIPVGLSLLLFTVGWRVLDRRVSRAAAVVFALLLLLPPRAWLHLSLIAWGNHYESGVLCTVAALLLVPPRQGSDVGAARALGAGLLLGLALWVGFSALYALPAVLAWLLLARRWRTAGLVALGIPAVLLPWGLQGLLAGTSPFSGIYEAGETLPLMSRVPHKLANLLHPRQVAGLFGLREHLPGQVLGLAWGGAALVATSLAAWRSPRVGRLAALLALAWVGIYATVRFEMGLPPAPEVNVPGTLRYAAPLYPALFLGISVGVGGLWDRGGRRWAVLLMAPVLAAGLGARALQLSSPFPAWRALDFAALNHEGFRVQASWQLEGLPLPAELDDPWSASLHGYRAGRTDALAAFRDGGSGPLGPPIAGGQRPYWEGVGAALADQLDPQGQGGLAFLTELDAWLVDHGVDATARQTALRQAAWTRRHAPHAVQQALQGYDDQAVPTLGALLVGVEPEVADALWFAGGRRWALDITGWFTPASHLSLPPLSDPHPALVEGLALGLAEHWGPAAAWPGQPTIPLGTAATEQLLDHSAQGAALRWPLDPQARAPTPPAP